MNIDHSFLSRADLPADRNAANSLAIYSELVSGLLRGGHHDAVLVQPGSGNIGGLPPPGRWMRFKAALVDVPIVGKLPEVRRASEQVLHLRQTSAHFAEAFFAARDAYLHSAETRGNPIEPAHGHLARRVQASSAGLTAAEADGLLREVRDAQNVAHVRKAVMDAYDAGRSAGERRWQDVAGPVRSAVEDYAMCWCAAPTGREPGFLDTGDAEAGARAAIALYRELALTGAAGAALAGKLRDAIDAVMGHKMGASIGAALQSLDKHLADLQNGAEEIEMFMPAMGSRLTTLRRRWQDMDIHALARELRCPPDASAIAHRVVETYTQEGQALLQRCLGWSRWIDSLDLPDTGRTVLVDFLSSRAGAPHDPEVWIEEVEEMLAQLAAHQSALAPIRARLLGLRPSRRRQDGGDIDPLEIDLLLPGTADSKE